MSESKQYGNDFDKVAVTEGDKRYRIIKGGDFFGDEYFTIPTTLRGLERGSVGGGFAAGATGKSMYFQQTLITHAAGKDIFGLFGGDYEPHKESNDNILANTFKFPQFRGVYISLEDKPEPFFNRSISMKPFIEPDLLPVIRENFLHIDMAGKGFKFAEKRRSPTGSLEIMPTGDLKRLIEELYEWKPDIIFIDTLIRAARGLSENDNNEMSPMIGILEQMAVTLNASVVFLHHVSKGAAMTGAKEQTASRGASCIVDDSRWAINLAKPTPEEIEEQGLDQNNRSKYVWLYETKMNHVAMREGRLLVRNAGGVLTPASTQFHSATRVEGSELDTLKKKYAETVAKKRKAFERFSELPKGAESERLAEEIKAMTKQIHEYEAKLKKWGAL